MDNNNNLWTKLFTRNDQQDEIELHSAGATVRHRNPFENLEIPRNEKKLSSEFVKTWAVPFYMAHLSLTENDTIRAFAEASNKIDIGIVNNLLGDFNWRTRIFGAHFAAIKDYKELDDTIGRHLLKSEVCYTGVGYCLALAVFATPKAKEHLISYLEYYLQRKDLGFEQGEALCALEHLDPSAANQFMDKWKDFISDTPRWNLDNTKSSFLERLEVVSKIREVAKQL